MDIAAEMAAGIDDITKNNVFDKGHPVIDWQKNDDIKGRMKIEIDDLLFDIKNKYDLEISFDHIDQLIAACIKVAETKYKN
jgi:type I restriction enzyme R subunit